MASRVLIAIGLTLILALLELVRQILTRSRYSQAGITKTLLQA